MSDKCKNCGGNYGLHHYETNQCPVGGFEAAPGKRQEWGKTTFEPDNSIELSQLQKENKLLLARIEALEKRIVRLESESDLEESVRIWGAG